MHSSAEVLCDDCQVESLPVKWTFLHFDTNNGAVRNGNRRCKSALGFMKDWDADDAESHEENSEDAWGIMTPECLSPRNQDVVQMGSPDADRDNDARGCMLPAYIPATETLRRADGVSLGLTFADDGGDGLRIIAIEANSSVDAFNALMWDSCDYYRQILVGDRLVSVNGTGSITAMLQECSRAWTLELHILKKSGALQHFTFSLPGFLLFDVKPFTLPVVHGQIGDTSWSSHCGVYGAHATLALSLIHI